MIADVPLDDEVARAARERVRARLRVEIAATAGRDVAGGPAASADGNVAGDDDRRPVTDPGRNFAGRPDRALRRPRGLAGRRERVRARLRVDIAATAGRDVAGGPAASGGDDNCGPVTDPGGNIAGRRNRALRRAPALSGRLRVLALVAVVAVAGGGVALVSGLGDGSVAPPSSAAAVLRAAADAAARAPAPGAIPPGRFLYVRTTHMEPKVIHRGGETFRVFIRYVDEDWTARDGSGRNRSTPAAPSFPTARDRAAWIRAGRPSARAMVGNYLPIMGGTDRFAPPNPRHAFPARSGGRGFPYAAIRALPTIRLRLSGSSDGS